MARLILAATDLEVALLREKLEARPEEPLLDYPVCRATRSGRDIVLMTTGPGMANAAAAAALAIREFHPLHVFNVGVCGVYADDRGLLGRVVVGTHAVFADTGVEAAELFLPLQKLGLPLANLRSTGQVFNIIRLHDEPIGPEVLRGDFSTVAACSGDARRAEMLKGRFKVDAQRLICEDMESAAIALVCLKAALRCTVLRGISNLCGDRDPAGWQLADAAAACQAELLKHI